MKALVMCGGFARRLGEIAKNGPKPLIEVGGKPVVEYIVSNLERTSVDEIIISTNAHFDSQFEGWIKARHNKKRLRVVVEPANSEEEKLGAIGAIDFVINSLNIEGDLLVINGDNLFDYEVADVLDFYSRVRSPIIVAYDVKSKDLAKLLGVITISGTQVVNFVEKPENPASTLVGTGCYIFPKGVLHRFAEYLSAGNNPDATGFFIQWLYRREKVHAFVHNGLWFDIGSVESLEEARKQFSAFKLPSESDTF